MDENIVPVPANIPMPQVAICPRCHFSVKPEYYFCPNCGAKLTDAPLATDSMTQMLIYGFSIILPLIAYLAITKWPGIKYLRSQDEKAKQIGIIALGLLIVSSVIMFWLTYVWIQGYIQSSVSNMSSLGL
jgi:hypothetical protein